MGVPTVLKDDFDIQFKSLEKKIQHCVVTFALMDGTDSLSEILVAVETVALPASLDNLSTLAEAAEQKLMGRFTEMVKRYQNR